MSTPTFDARGQAFPDGPRSESSAAADGAARRDAPAAAASSTAVAEIAANPFASFEGERTVVAAISPIILRLARGMDGETKKYEAPPELLALARASARERALRRASKALPPTPTPEPGAPSRASEPPPRLEPSVPRSGSWRRFRACVMARVEWVLALWH